MEQPEIDAAERDVEDIERALQRLDDGTHGACEVCGKPIADDVLAATPTMRTCTEHTSPFGTEPATPFGTEPATPFGTEPATPFGTEPA